MELKFSIENQIIKRIDNEILVSKTRNAVDATFTFNELWNDSEKIVIFRDDQGRSIREYLGKLGASYTIPVPSRALCGRYFSVTVYAGDLLTTNTLIVYLKDSGYHPHHHKHHKHNHDCNCDEDKDIFIDIYEKLHSRFDSLDFRDNNLSFYSDGELLCIVNLPFADETTVMAWMAEADIKFASIATTLEGKADKIVLDESKTLNKENTSTATFTITYTDDTTEDVEVVIIPSNSSGA